MGWTLKRSETLPARLRPEFAKLMETWQQKAPEGSIHRKEIADTAFAWLEELENKI
jgi:hypothetical protein